MFDFLRELVIVFAAAVVIAAVLRRFGIPTIAGLIATGVLAGPGALGVVRPTDDIDHLAEIGVVLLLFGIGLELSLDRLRRIWKVVVIGGAMQVVLTALMTALLAISLGLPVRAGIFLGLLISVSSTAIVLRGLSGRGELDAPHGRLALGILVFQDLAVVPMMMLVPFLAGTGGSTADLLKTAGLSVLVLALVLVAARVVVPRLLGLVAATRERDLFIMTVFLICFGTAWAVSSVGVSIALGAFLAGLVVAGSEFRHQALSDLIPAREVLASLFMVSVGLLVDLSAVGANIGTIAGLLVLVVVGKAVIVLGVAFVLRFPLRIGILTAAALCQIGEFSFVLLRAARGTSMVSAQAEQNLLAAIVASMVVTPLALQFGPRLAARVSGIRWRGVPRGGAIAGGVGGTELKGHVLIAGFGLAGQTLALRLRELKVPYAILDVNPDNVHRGRQDGEPMLLADVTAVEVLHELSIASARMLVVAINDPGATERAVRAAHAEAPALEILVRCPYASEVERLYRAGATQVISMEVEGANRVAEWVAGQLMPDKAR